MHGSRQQHHSDRRARQRVLGQVCVASAVLLVAALGGPGSGARRAFAVSPQLVSPGPHRGDAGRFGTWTGYNVDQAPTAVATADFNGDGHPDVAYARYNQYKNSISVQMNLGDGTMGTRRSYPAVAASNDIAAGDLNGDGRPDLVVVSDGLTLTNHVVDVYLNTGSGRFTHSTVTAGTAPARVAVADLNGDGRLDLALTNRADGANDVSVLLGSGTGTFGAETRYPVGVHPEGVAVADVNGDGRPDLAVASYDQVQLQAHLTVLSNDGAGHFPAKLDRTISNGPRDPVIAAGDWNRDGRMDLAVAGGGTDQVFIFTNTGNLAFVTTAVTAAFSSTALRARDVDANGSTDLVDAAPSATSRGEVVLLRNSGTGSFGPPIVIDAGAQPTGLGIADFNGDLRLDLAVANRGSETGSIDPQRADGSFANPPVYQGGGFLPLATASADFNGDGTVDIAEASDNISVLTNDGTGRFAVASTLPSGVSDSGALIRSVYAADLNNDGHPDLVWAPDSPPYPYVYALNNGDGTFGPVHTRAIQTCGTGHVTTADVNNDGFQDVLVANNRGGGGACQVLSTTVRVALNNGNGTFKADYGVTVEPLPEMAIGVDVNGDGRTDLVSCHPGAFGDRRQVTVSLGTGAGRFAPHVTYTVANGPTEIAVADLNRDGHPDLATANEGGDDIAVSARESTSVLLNDGTGKFTRVSTLPGENVFSYFNESAISLGDLNGDAVPDIAVANAIGQDVGVYYGRGDGTFRQEIRYGVHNSLIDLNLADYNGDGKLDIAGPNAIGNGFVPPNGVAVLLNGGR